MSSSTPSPSAPSRGAVVVTGASTGIGHACALMLARAGFRVFAGVRKEADAQALRAQPGVQITPLILDVTDEAQIRAAVETVAQAVGAAGLAGLVNNAGVGVAWPLEFMPVDKLRAQFEVNVFGQLAVTQAFLPLLRAATGRVVNIGSVGGRITLPFGGPLMSSKHALTSLNDALRMELRPFGLHVCLVEPGAILTAAVDKLESDAEATLREMPPLGREYYAEAFRAMTKRAVDQHRVGSSPDVVAAAVLHALTARRPKTRYPVGAGARLLVTLPRLLPDRVLDLVRLRILGLPRGFGVRATRHHEPLTT